MSFPEGAGIVGMNKFIKPTVTKALSMNDVLKYGSTSFKIFGISSGSKKSWANEHILTKVLMLRLRFVVWINPDSLGSTKTLISR